MYFTSLKTTDQRNEICKRQWTAFEAKLSVFYLIHEDCGKTEEQMRKWTFMLLPLGISTESNNRKFVGVAHCSEFHRFGINHLVFKHELEQLIYCIISNTEVAIVWIVVAVGVLIRYYIDVHMRQNGEMHLLRRSDLFPWRFIRLFE